MLIEDTSRYGTTEFDRSSDTQHTLGCTRVHLGMDHCTRVPSDVNLLHPGLLGCGLVFYSGLLGHGFGFVSCWINKNPPGFMQTRFVP